MSGGVVFRCQDEAGGLWALKRWPESASHARASEVHRVWRTAQQEGCRLVPALAWAGPVGSQLWELSEWMPGKPLEASADAGAIRSGARAIADFHGKVAGLGTRLAPAPAVLARIERLDQLAQFDQKAGAADLSHLAPRTGASVQRARQMLVPRWASVRRELLAQLDPWSRCPVRLQYVLRDVHREHVLFDRGEPTGLIDFDAIRIDTVAADLARWVGRFLASEPAAYRLAGSLQPGQDRGREIWHAALAGLSGHSLFPDVAADANLDIQSPVDWQQTLALAGVLHRATTWISLANWLQWTLVDRRLFLAGDRGVSERIDELTRLAGADRGDGLDSLTGNSDHK